MFKISERLLLDVYVIGSKEPATHPVSIVTVARLDEILADPRGVLKIAAGEGAFIRYPVRSITSVVDRTERDRKGARVDLYQAEDGDLYLADPDNANEYAYPLLPADERDGDTVTPFGSDAYSLIDGDVKLEELTEHLPVGVSALLHIASSNHNGSVTVVVPADQLGDRARIYLGNHTTNRIGGGE